MVTFEYDSYAQIIKEEFKYIADRYFRPYSILADKISEIPEELKQKFDISHFNRSMLPEDMGGRWNSIKHEGKDISILSNILYRVICIKELCQGDAGLTIAMPGPGMATTILDAMGNEEQRKKYFSIFNSNKPRWAAFALTEPDSGTDTQFLRTLAKKDGNTYIINGSKIFITNGDKADWILLFCTTDPQKGHFAQKVFIVEKGIPGFEVLRIEDKLGQKAAHIAQLQFDNCRIPEENIVGFGGGKNIRHAAFSGAKLTFQKFRPVVAAISIGISFEAINQLKGMLGKLNNKHIKKIINLMEMKTYGAWLLCLKSAYLFDIGKDNFIMASIAKAHAARVGHEICETSIEIANKCRIWKQDILQKLLRDVIACDLLEGTGDIQRIMTTMQMARYIR